MNLKECINLQSQQIALTSTLDGRSIVVFVKNIIYITRYKDSNNTFVNYQDAFTGRLMCVSVRGTLKDFNEILPNQFQMVSRSVIINLRYLISYSKDEVTLWTPESNFSFPHTYHVSRFIVEI